MQQENQPTETEGEYSEESEEQQYPESPEGLNNQGSQEQNQHSSVKKSRIVDVEHSVIPSIGLSPEKSSLASQSPITVQKLKTNSSRVSSNHPQETVQNNTVERSFLNSKTLGTRMDTSAQKVNVSKASAKKYTQMDNTIGLIPRKEESKISRPQKIESFHNSSSNSTSFRIKVEKMGSGKEILSKKDSVTSKNETSVNHSKVQFLNNQNFNKEMQMETRMKKAKSAFQKSKKILNRYFATIFRVWQFDYEIIQKLDFIL